MSNQLTINELRAYQAGQLDGPARHRVERLLLEDPFYADALEGLEALQRRGASLPKQTAQLRRALHERINESATERRLFPLWVTTMAASIALVMGVALYFIYTTKPLTTAVKKPTVSTPSEPIVVEIGPNDSAIAKTVETVAVLEAHTAQLRVGNEVVSHLQSAKRGPMSVQAALPLPVQKQPVPIPSRVRQAEDANQQLALSLEEPKINYRRITNPERAFGPNAPEPPDVTFWSDNLPRLSLARSFAASPQSVASDTPNGILLAPITVVGYGTESQRTLTGAVSAIKPTSAPQSAKRGSVSLPTRTVKTIEGTITDQQGDPLPGVSVRVKGTNWETITNAAGQFSLDSTLVAGQTLSIAYIGFKNQELNPLALKNGPIQLAEDTVALNEVVVTGYGRVKRGGSGTEKVNRRKSIVLTRDIDLLMSGLNGPEKEAFLEYLKKEASPLFHGPLSVQIKTKADGTIKRVTVEDGVLIEEPNGKRHRDYKPTPEVVAEAERLARQYPNWPKKRQWILWLTGWGKK